MIQAQAQGPGGPGSRALASHLKPTIFLGYETAFSPARVLTLLNKRGGEIPAAQPASLVTAALDRTPFYAEGGGQIGDRGVLRDLDDAVVAEVLDTQSAGSVLLHRLRLRASLAKGQLVRAVVDGAHRRAMAARHTAIHLLNAAVRRVIASNPRQLGCLVSPESLHTDFALGRDLTLGELIASEALANQAVRERLPIQASLRPSEDALRLGALHVAGESHTDRPRFVLIGKDGWSRPESRFSLEICGGIHCRDTRQVGWIKILGQERPAAGILRLKALVHLRRNEA